MLRHTCLPDMTGSPTITLPAGHRRRAHPSPSPVSRHFEETPAIVRGLGLSAGDRLASAAPGAAQPALHKKETPPMTSLAQSITCAPDGTAQGRTPDVHQLTGGEAGTTTPSAPTPTR
jgi:hypothetical protein